MKNTLEIQPGRWAQRVRLGSKVNPQEFKWFFEGAGRTFIPPEDFTPELPCNFYRDKDDNYTVKHDMDFSQYTGGTEIYVDLDNGNDSNDGSLYTPKKTIRNALESASSGEDSAYCIKVLSDSLFYRGEGYAPSSSYTITDKTVSIIPANSSGKIKIINGDRALSWTDDGSGTWKASRSSSYAVYDLRITDENGIEIPLPSASSVVDCKANANTWFTDGTLVYIHTADGSQPDSNYIVAMTPSITYLLGTAKLYVENMTVLGGSTVSAFDVRGDATGSTTVGEFVANNCNFIGSNLRYQSNAGNGLSIQDVKNVFLFNCKSAYTMLDGFNYHYANVPEANRRSCLIIEHNCNAYDCGIPSTLTSNNGTSCHEGINSLRFNGDYVNTKGYVVADVNGCYSVIVDCNARDNIELSAVYCFVDQGSPAGVTGKLIMINSKHEGETLDSPDLYIKDLESADLYSTDFQNVQFGSDTPTYH